MMSYFVAGILRIIILEASVALLIITRVLASASARHQRRLDFAWRCLAVIALFSWTNYGHMRDRDGIVNRWEQYHFYFGSKYLPELGYFNLYKATLLADRESTRMLAGITTTRDLSNFEEVPLAAGLKDAAAVRAAFSDARWSAFKDDWTTFARSGNDEWNHILVDHGNSGSPAWAIFAAPVARLTGISLRGQNLIALGDYLLMIVLFVFLAHSFGARHACLAVVIFSTTPFSFDYLSGSLLRWDWLFALGMCLCFWRRERPAIAGAFLGYAIASKLFPLWFGVGFACHAAWTFARTRRFDRRWLRFAAGGVLALSLAIAISSAMFGGLRIWRGYAERIDAARVEKYYGNQYSFRTIFLQIQTSRPDELVRDFMAPPVIKQSLREVDISQFRWRFLGWQLLLTALIAVALRYSDALEALAIGPLLVYVWLIVNAYYWNMLALTALAWSVGKRMAALIALHAIFISFYVYQHLGHNHAGCYFFALLFLGLLLLWVTSTLLPATLRPAYDLDGIFVDE